MDSFDPCKDSNGIQLIPSGCIELIFHFGGKGKYAVKDKEFLITESSICGQKLNYVEYFSNNTTGLLSVVLYPEKANVILGMPASLFSNTTYDLESVLGKSAAELIEKIGMSNCAQSKIKIVEEFFSNFLFNTKLSTDPRMKEFVRIVSLNGGCIKIESLAERLNISKRQLERKVIETIGLSPKEFSRIIRFQKSLYIKQLKPELNLTSLAYESGFADQSHFIKEFKSISGLSPSIYFTKSPAFSDYYSLL